MDRLSSLFYHLREGVQTGSTVIPSYVWRSMPVSWSMRGLRLLWFTPGVGGTGILFGKDSGCPKWLAALGRRALDCFHDKGAGASLVNVQAVCTEYQPYLYIHPSLFGDTIGKPVISAMPEKFRKGSVRNDADTIIREKITQKKII